jgi:hypothetical protein
MHPVWRVVLRGGAFVLVGALLGALIGFLAFLPGSIPTTEVGHPTRMPWGLAMGVAFWCARMGGLVGLLAFFLYRTLTGQVADPRNARRTAELDLPPLNAPTATPVANETPRAP